MLNKLHFDNSPGIKLDEAAKTSRKRNDDFIQENISP